MKDIKYIRLVFCCRINYEIIIGMCKDCETNIDFLDFDYLVDVAKRVVLNDDLTPSTIGIYGYCGGVVSRV